MKTLIFIALASSLVFARGTSVKGHFKKSGSYVQPHKRSQSNSFKSDNYSHKGNINPYNGKKGYKK